MPRGIPKNGVRKKRIARRMIEKQSTIEFVTNETDQQIETRLQERFDILNSLVDQAISGFARAIIVSGPAGLGKSYTIEQTLEKWDPNQINHTIVKGYVKATGLYKLLYQHKDKGKVIVFDDADSIFFDDVSLNMLKAVCDTSEKRTVSYLSEGNLVDEETAVRIPKSFRFDGTIIFITNYDFDSMIDRGHKLAPHLNAMVSRSHYIDLAMKSSRDYLIRIKQVIGQGLLNTTGLNANDQKQVVEFIESNKDNLRELSLRIALKIAAIRKTNKPNWNRVAKVTCTRGW